MKIGILGYGEIGRAIAKFYIHPKIKDLKRNDGLEGIEILHVCIPYSKSFIEIVKKEISEYNPKLTIIHSTVPLGTTKKIGGSIVHSPCRGVHPNLFQGLKTFVKYIGFDNHSAGRLAQEHFRSLGLETLCCYDSRNTEAMKLWDTTQYGMFIILNKEIYKYCKKNKLNFDFVYTIANFSYNKGYTKLNKKNVVRPYLNYVPGEIGGHCVIPNCHLLDSSISKFILSKNNN